MKSRIEQLIKSEGYTASKFADILGVQASNISHILSGRNKPSLDFVEKVLIKFPTVNPDWLITGNGSIYRSNNIGGAHEIITEDLVTIVTSNTLFSDDSDYNCNNDETKKEKNSIITECEEVSTDQQVHASIQDQTKTKTKTEDVLLQDEMSDSDIDRIVIFYKNKQFVSYKP